jgi:hypothetical protein
MFETVESFVSGNDVAKVVFVTGRVLRGRVEVEKTQIFGSRFRFNDFIDAANSSLKFYKFQLRSYRRAVDTWTVVGLRNKVVRDIRKMIAKIIWECREEAEYDEHKQVLRAAKRANVRGL